MYFACLKIVKKLTTNKQQIFSKKTMNGKFPFEKSSYDDFVMIINDTNSQNENFFSFMNKFSILWKVMTRDRKKLHLSDH